MSAQDTLHKTHYKYPKIASQPAVFHFLEIASQSVVFQLQVLSTITVHGARWALKDDRPFSSEAHLVHDGRDEKVQVGALPGVAFRGMHLPQAYRASEEREDKYARRKGRVVTQKDKETVNQRHASGRGLFMKQRKVG